MATEHARIRAELQPFLARSNAWAVILLGATIVAYVAAVAGAVAFAAWPLKALCALLAGSVIASLFVIGHDAAHGAFTDARAVNGAIGRISFLPSLHNYSLWQVAHNRFHHADVNVKGMNSWSPRTKAEFDAMPGWRRAVERLYRTPLGLGPYYLVERWWKDKFFPRRSHPAGVRPTFVQDFTLVAGWLVLFTGGLAVIGAVQAGAAGAVSAVFWGFLVPFLVWNWLMGGTTYLQHTSPRVPWFRSRKDWERTRSQEELTVHIEVPRWYGFVSHHIMDHPAHHVLPKIPLYNIGAAQRRLNELMGENAVRERFTPRYLLSSMRRCKLYDYDGHRWLQFDGQPTSDALLQGVPDYPVPGLGRPFATA